MLAFDGFGIRRTALQSPYDVKTKLSVISLDPFSRLTKIQHHWAEEKLLKRRRNLCPEWGSEFTDYWGGGAAESPATIKVSLA